MSNKKSPEQQQLNIAIDEDVADGIYSNLAIINHSASEFIVDFITVMPGSPKAKVKSRVILTPEIKSQSILKTNNKKLIVTPIHFSDENNSSGLSKKNIKEIKTGKF